MSLRVLHITRDAPPRDNGGISTAVRLLVEATELYGHCSHLHVSFDGWRPQQSSKSAALDEVTNAGVRLSHPGQLDRAKAWVLDQHFDVLHVHDPLLWDFAAGVRDTLDVPAVYTAHIVQQAANRIRNIERATRSSQAEERALREADRIHVASTYARNLLVRAGVDSSRVTAVRWPVDIPSGTAVGSASEQTQSDHAMQPGSPDLAVADMQPALIMSRFGYLKGTDRAFDLLIRWFRVDETARCDWVGGLPDSPKGERRWVKKWRSRAGDLERHLRFRGWEPRAEAIGRLTPGRIVICPSRHESFGLAIAEAMAAGCVVVSARCGGSEELIENGVSGVILEGDIAEPGTFRQLRELRESRDCRSRMGAEARNRIRHLCDPAIVSRQFASMYRASLART